LAQLIPLQIRQNAVRELTEKTSIREGLSDHLDGMSDMERIIARASTGRASPRDLLGLAKGIRRLPAIAELAQSFESERLCELTRDMDLMEDVADDIEKWLSEDPANALKEGGLIKDGVHEELDELRHISQSGKDWISAFQEAEQRRTGIPTLKVGYNKVFGYYIEISKSYCSRAPKEYERKQTLTNGERYATPALLEQETKVLGAEERIGELEYELFLELRNRVAANGTRAQRIAEMLGQLDAISSLAESAERYHGVFPELHEGLETKFIQSRHPVIEMRLSDWSFVPNDIHFGADNRIAIITGPNMAGKSTYIRQAALLMIMAQIGAAVPAKSAKVGLCDRVCARVGASDDLAKGQSTFMVEMTEIASILNQATEKSFLVLDEVGRGTSTFDGVAIAWAVTEWIGHKIGARTLFATHYHELTELGDILPRAKNYNITVQDVAGEVVFQRTVKEGASDRSYGIQVAKMAGIPLGVLKRASIILTNLETAAASRRGTLIVEGDALRAVAKAAQGHLFSDEKKVEAADKEELVYHCITELRKMDVSKISVKQLRQWLSEWQNKLL